MASIRFVVLQGPGNESGDTTAQTLDPGSKMKVTQVDTINPGFAFTGNSGLGEFTASKDFTANATTDVCTAATHGFYDGQKVQLTNVGGGLPGGLVVLTDYYVIVLTANTFKLSTSFTLALQGEGVVDITTAGTGTHTAATADVSAGTMKNAQAKKIPSASPTKKGSWTLGFISAEATPVVKGATIKNIQKLKPTTSTEGGVTYQWYRGTI